MADKATRKRERRDLNPISLSFLDVMSCGFGAVVLIFLIIDHNAQNYQQIADPNLRAEANMLQEDIRTGQENQVQIRNTINAVDLQIVEAQGLARQVQEEVDNYLEELQRMQNQAGASEADIEQLREELVALEVELEEMREAGEASMGDSIREFIGDGNRQYLTGMVMGGNRVLVLVDVSASMMDDTIVNIIRRRSMGEEAQRSSAKWQQVLATVDWLTAQLPPPSRYQLYAFNNEVRSLISNSEGTWQEVADENTLNQAVEELNTLAPSEGTNLVQLFIAIQALNPLPDNIYLITDGLPTLDNSNRSRSTISGQQRMQLFNQALRELPSGIPVNVILLPLEGDPLAASAYWRLAVATGGSFLNPSPDWP